MPVFDLYANSLAWAHLIAFVALFVWLWALSMRWGAFAATAAFLPAAIIGWFIAFPVAFAWPLLIFLPLALVLRKVGQSRRGAQWRSAQIASARRW